MKKILHFLVLILCQLFLVNQASAQGTAFTYQGRLSLAGAAADGNYDLTFTLHDSSSGGSPLVGTLTNNLTAVSSGYFTVILDFGAGVFDGSPRWLEIGVRTNGSGAFTTLNPRQRITATPYAITAGDVTDPNIARLNVSNTSQPASGTVTVTSGFITGASVTSGGSGYTTPPSVVVNDSTGSGATISATVSNGSVVALSVTSTGSGYSSGATLTIAPPPSNAYQTFAATNFFSGVNTLSNTANLFNGTFRGDGINLSNVNAATLEGLPASTFWRISGNAGTVPGTHFLGTTDNQPLEFRVNNLRALRLENGADSLFDSGTIPDGAPNLIGGSPINYVLPGMVGAVVAGGGATNYNGIAYTNAVLADFGTVGGGYGNRVYAHSATISGGYGNLVWSNANNSVIVAGALQFVGPSSSHAIIGGGQRNEIGTNVDYATIAGGVDNTIWGGATFSAIVGGQGNTIRSNSSSALIGGGYNNTIRENASFVIIGGGYQNVASTNTDNSFIGGGFGNHIWSDSTSAVIGGGSGNTISTNSDASMIGGGSANLVGVGSIFVTIGGGNGNNTGTNTDYSSILGGFSNAIRPEANYATIGGGYIGEIGTNANFATIGGGNNNTILDGADSATIPGGINNTATTNAFAAGTRARALHHGSFVWADGVNLDLASTNNNSVTMRAFGGYRLFSSFGTGVYLAQGSGSWSSLSDRNTKENLVPVNTREILEKVAALPLTRWNYITQPASTRHIGPMAQDFYAAFGVGENEVSITSVDADGVALAAIQGLNQKLQEELKRRDLENAALLKRLEALEKIVGK